MAQKPAGSEPAPRPSPRSGGSGPDWTPVRKNRGRVVAAIVALAMLLTAIGGTAVSILGASSASAHDRLVSSDPADGAELDAPVDTLTLTFSAAIIPDGTQVRVSTPAAEVDADVAVDGETVTATFDPPAEGGEHRVQWRAVSADGHPIEGELAYDVAAPAEPSPEASEPADAGAAEAELEESGELEGLGAAAPEPSSSPAGGGAGTEPEAGGAMPLVYGAVLVALVGTAGVLVARSRRRLHQSVEPGRQDGPQG
ncbi:MULTISPECIES: copper resistance CopC family protein [Isoptericola]|uniref:copper resistance CopC family protein n=1 Tax=Isoptericola TaxID=254250 RepID=UPI000F6492A4|nr:MULTISPECIES: copper resistance CopC family protein [Isoptericola]